MSEMLAERMRGMLAMAITSEDAFNWISPAGFRLLGEIASVLERNALGVKEASADLQTCWDALQAETKRADVAEAKLIAWRKSLSETEEALAALEDAARWHDAQDKAISKQPNASTGHNGWMRNEHQEQATLLRAAHRTLEAKAEEHPA